MNDTVLRWAYRDDHIMPLDQQLRARPNEWAVVAYGLHDGELKYRVNEIWRQLGEEFEVDTPPCDDSIYGVLYEIRARYTPDVKGDEVHA